MTAARLLGHAHLDIICWNGSKGASLGFDAETNSATASRRKPASRRQPRYARSTNVLRAERREDHRARVAARRRLSARWSSTEFDKRGYRVVAEQHSGFTDNFSYCTRCQTTTS